MLVHVPKGGNSVSGRKLVVVIEAQMNSNGSADGLVAKEATEIKRALRSR
jgi:hypothetical protein